MKVAFMLRHRMYIVALSLAFVVTLTGPALSETPAVGEAADSSDADELEAEDTTAGPSTQIGLAELIRLASEESLTLRQAATFSEQAKVEKRSARSAFRPNLTGRTTPAWNDSIFAEQRTSLGISGALEYGLDYSLTYDQYGQPIGTTGRTGSQSGTSVELGLGIWGPQSISQRMAQRRSALRLSESTQMDARQRTNLAWAEILSAYWDWRVAIAQLNISRQGHGLALKQLRIIRKRIAAGLVAKLGAAQWEAREAIARVEVADAKQGLIFSEQRLRTLLMLTQEAHPRIEATGPWGPNALGELDSGNLKIDNPLVGQANALADRAAEVLRSERQNGAPAFRAVASQSSDVPSVDLLILDPNGGGIVDNDTQVTDPNFSSGFVGLEVEVPLGFDQNDIARQQAAIDLRRAEYTRDQTKVDVETQFAASKRALEIALSQWKTQRAAVAKLQTALDVEKLTFDRGRSSAFQVILAQERLLFGQRTEVFIRRALTDAYLQVLLAAGNLSEWAASKGAGN